MTLTELITELRELRDQRGGECAVKITNGEEEMDVAFCRADTTTGRSIIEIVAE